MQNYLDETYIELETAIGSWQRYFHALSLTAIPNFLKSPKNAVRYEVMCRLTRVAILMKRYELSHKNLPQEIFNQLVPEFLASVPIDCIDGQPLRYKLNKDGSFLLYSVGSNGKDDGGDASLAEGKKLDIWTGRDAVWPKPALP